MTRADDFIEFYGITAEIYISLEFVQRSSSS